MGTATLLEPPKRAEENTKAFDLNQKTMQALDTLSENTRSSRTPEEGDMLFGVACEAIEELDKAQKDQDRVEVTCDSMVAASKEHPTCWANLNGAFAKPFWHKPSNLS